MEQDRRHRASETLTSYLVPIQELREFDIPLLLKRNIRYNPGKSANCH